MTSRYKFSRRHRDPEIMKIQQEISDNFLVASDIQKQIDILPDQNISEKGYILKTDGKKAYWDTLTGGSIPSIPSGSSSILHASTHEDGGSDEISIEGLSGIPTEMYNMSIAMSVALGMP